MTVLVLGGTNEGREAAAGLAAAGYTVLASTATGYGGEILKGIASVRSGCLTHDGLTELLKEHHVRVVVDATHPFALGITSLARAVCAGLDLPYLRFERGPSQFSRAGVESVISFSGAIEVVRRMGGRVFLATGVKSIGRFVGAAGGGSDGPEFFARVLPTVESVTEATRWLPPAHIVAAIGPFEHDFNRWCWRHFRVDTVVTKDSGAGVGVEAKVETALEMGLKIIVIERPEPAGDGIFELEALIERLAQAMPIRGAGV